MRVVICGAGIAGLALARRLRALGAEVIVLEHAPGPREQGYMMDFFGPGYEVADRFGLLPRLRELGYTVRELTYVDESGHRRVGMDYHRFSRLAGGRMLSIMRPDLELALHEQVDAEVRFGVSVAEVDNRPDGVRVRVTDGTSIQADLLVGADGIHSTVRRLVFGPEERFLRYLGLHTAAYTLDDPELYEEIDNRFCLTDTVGRQVGFYGLRDGRVAVFAVHRTAEATLPADPRAALRRAYGTLGWVVPQALAHCPEPARIYYDQVAQIALPQWHQRRVVLVGDACQAVSLLAGQGASLAMAAAYLLGGQLAAAGDIDTALESYQRRWQPLIAEKQAVARRGADWFLPASPTRLRVRRLALRLGNLPGVDRILGRGLLGDLNVDIDPHPGLSEDRGDQRPGSGQAHLAAPGHPGAAPGEHGGSGPAPGSGSPS